VQADDTEKIKTELKWLTEQLGPARDFDVLVKDGVAPLRKAAPDTEN
jgi:CHAD domain-containing protein